MGQVPHGSARTTHAIRGELQRSQVSVASLAKRYGINEKTVLKWRHRQSVEDLPMGPKERRSTVLSPMEEAAIVALRVQARLPLDDVYIALKDVIPHLTRSSLHRCLQRHGISRLPKADREKPKTFKHTRSATSTSTLPSCAMRAGRASFSSRWIAPQSWSSPASTARPTSLPQFDPDQIRAAAQARTSGENLLVVLLITAPPSRELEPPTNPGRSP
jgi:transposase-like protein